MSTGPDVTDIFISYASADRPRVKPLVDALRQQGWSVWWDRTILAGKTFDRVIEAALKDSRCVIVLWSRDSVDSDWVWTEADDGKRRGILVPAMLDEVNIPLAFRRIQTANLIGWSGALPSDQFNELSRAVSDVLSNGETWAPDARPPQETKRSTQQTQQQRDHNEEEANKTTLKKTESEQLEQEKQAQAEQERLEREQKEQAEQARAEQERLEKKRKAKAERERLDGKRLAQAGSRCKTEQLHICHNSYARIGVITAKEPERATDHSHRLCR